MAGRAASSSRSRVRSVPQISETLAQDLITAIHAAGDPFVPVRVESYTEALFRLSGKVKIDPDYESEKVLTAALTRCAPHFRSRTELRPAGRAERSDRARAGDCGRRRGEHQHLYRTGTVAILNARLEADLPNGGDPASLGAAELLTLDPAPIDLGVMP